MADIKFEDWKQSTAQVLGDRIPTSEKRRNFVELLVRIKCKREHISRWTAFAGSLCYSLERPPADSIPSPNRESLSLSAQLRPRSGNLSPYE